MHQHVSISEHTGWPRSASKGASVDVADRATDLTRASAHRAWRRYDTRRPISSVMCGDPRLLQWRPRPVAAAFRLQHVHEPGGQLLCSGSWWLNGAHIKRVQSISERHHQVTKVHAGNRLCAGPR